MFEIGNYVIYKNDVCKIVDLKKQFYHGNDYYVLKPVEDSSLMIETPVENKMGFMKAIMSKEEAFQLIAKIPKIEPIVCHDRMIEQEYKKLLNSGSKEALIQIIKTTYLRNKARTDIGKKTGSIDDSYFEKAEKLVYDELSISLGMTFEETKQYVIDTLTKIVS